MSSYIDIKVADGSFKAFVERPPVLPAPVVVVIQEVFGINADLRQTCREIASLGFIAISPDLFWRMEPGIDLSPRDEADWKKGFDLYSAFDVDAGVADIKATMDVARALPDATGRVGLMGFCVGGLMTFLVTARHGTDASVSYYGARTEEFLSEAHNIRSPLMMHLGESDEYIDKAARTAISKELAANDAATVFTYPGCRHAFARHGGAHYDQHAATLANGRTARFFESHLR